MQDFLTFLKARIVYGSRRASTRATARADVWGKRRRRMAARTTTNASRILARALKPPDFIAYIH